MAKSNHYRELSREVHALRVHFLPERFDPLGVYVDQPRVQAQTRAYLVLCHAAVETYFEGWAKELARRAEVLWIKKNRLSTPLAHLVSAAKDRLRPTMQAGISGSLDVAEKFDAMALAVFQEFYRVIKDNHGVKEENCLRLFCSLGISVSAFGSTLLPALDSFGSARGEHAHHASKAIVTPLDPETEHKRVEDLLTELGAFDSVLLPFRKTIR